ncbi:hypothetical protein ABT336_01695 [Micromonospora sp. NPDC000207]|uniref:PIN-like domain-containing protein n=1 Tax=Micromonospora sp. NPDC000207 TaxID=3154246 RepID=UPI00332787FC
MNRSKRSSESLPEFFADRCLGKQAPALLVERGWIVHVVSEHFPDDAQAVGDPEWIEYGLRRGWSLLTQDERISTQPTVKAMLRQYSGCIHCLDSANLAIQARVARFEAQRGAIHQNVRDRRVGFFVVRERGAPRRKR